MPWSTPTLFQVRSLVRDSLHGSLPGSDASIPNSVLRVMSDAQGATCFLTLEYIDWLALQLLPDTAETEWLDRHGQIWLVNSDGSIGRKQATLATGTIVATGVNTTDVPAGSQLGVGGVQGTYQTTEYAMIGVGPTQIPVTAIFAGTAGNLPPGTEISFIAPPHNLDQVATVLEMDGGNETETDEELRGRILLRIQEPPMGGDKTDYENWALAVPGVTRAWCAGNEFGIGTVTVRFMMDDLRSDNDGFPYPEDVIAVQAYIDQMRPVTVKDCYVEAPLKYPIDVNIGQLSIFTNQTQAQIETSIRNMLFEKEAPGQTIYASWKSFAIMNSPNVVSFQLLNDADDVMPAPGYMGVMGTLYVEPAPPPAPS